MEKSRKREKGRKEKMVKGKKERGRRKERDDGKKGGGGNVRKEKCMCLTQDCTGISCREW